MTKEEKQLLLKDLCARLTYGIKVWYKYYPTNVTESFATSIRLADNKIALSTKLNKEGDWYPIEEAKEILIKPYLRPMSSMTEEEKEEFHKLKQFSVTVVMPNGVSLLKPAYIVDLDEDGEGLNHLYDWLNAHHFDYRGLIPIGLALEAKEGMYNINEK